jgi:HEPN domain-containing protein
MDNNKQLAIEWLKAAKDDLENIKYIVKVNNLTNIVAFHSQQAIEKSLKALIEYKKLPMAKTHNLEKLYKKLDNMIELDYDRLELVNESYIDSRYPGDMGLLPYGKPTLEDAKGFYDFAQIVFDKVCIMLKVDTSEIEETSL